MSSNPKISIVIPIHNEESILEFAVEKLTEKLKQNNINYEILLAENGSIDNTLGSAQRLQKQINHLQVFHIAEPNYGRALKQGILESHEEIVVCDEIDLGDINFYKQALTEILNGADLVVGSKRHLNSNDARPFIRRLGTSAINFLLRLTLSFRGTDTHGPKVLKKSKLVSVIQSCCVEHNLFASELVIRAQRAGLKVLEIPIQLQEIRAPSVGLLRRIPRVLNDLMRLIWIIRFKKN